LNHIASTPSTLLRDERQGNRIWIFHPPIAGRRIDSDASASFSMAKSTFLRAMYEQIDIIKSRIQTDSGFFCDSDVKKIPNAIPLETSADMG
jgi:hypothetical protein